MLSVQQVGCLYYIGIEKQSGVESRARTSHSHRVGIATSAHPHQRKRALYLYTYRVLLFNLAASLEL